MKETGTILKVCLQSQWSEIRSCVVGGVLLREVGEYET